MTQWLKAMKYITADRNVVIIKSMDETKSCQTRSSVAKCQLLSFRHESEFLIYAPKCSPAVRYVSTVIAELKELKIK